MTPEAKPPTFDQVQVVIEGLKFLVYAIEVLCFGLGAHLGFTMARRRK